MSPNGTPAVASPTIVISLTPNGGVQTKFANIPNRPVANMMLETARQDIIRLFLEQEAEHATSPHPMIAPPGLRVERNPDA